MVRIRKRVGYLPNILPIRSEDTQDWLIKNEVDAGARDVFRQLDSDNGLRPTRYVSTYFQNSVGYSISRCISDHFPPLAVGRALGDMGTIKPFTMQ